MLKNTKRGIFILLVMLCITFAFVIGCGSIEMPGAGGENKPKPKPETSQLSAVSAASVQFSETAHTLVVEWGAVPNATSYNLRITKSTSTSIFSLDLKTNSIDLRALEGFLLPDNGSITIRFTAKASGYPDSEYTTITYELEGTLLLSPEITSFANGVITWKNVAGATSYTVKVDGAASETQTNTYDVSSLSANAIIEIAAKIGGRTGSVTKVAYDAAAQKLTMLPISTYTVDGDILRWEELGGVAGYKIVDLSFNSYTVTTPYYVMSTRNVLYGVYPVMPASSPVASAEVESVDIKYLQGSGTEANPYLIKTPFDLRTIDYYELKNVEAGNPVKNYYKIVNDINYNTVSVLESESNIFTLRKPFFGVLDGDNHTLSNIRVKYNDGFWALFEHIADDAIVKNIKFDNIELSNRVKDEKHPTNPATAMVAYRNYGTITEVALSNASIEITAGSAAGIVIHNFGTVSKCTVNAVALTENSTSLMGSAAYEMAGVVLENYGTVNENTVISIIISGRASNIGASAGVVSINRTGGVVTDNSYDDVTIKNLKNGKEAGGVVAYCAADGTVTKGQGTLGTFYVGRSATASQVTSNTSSTGIGKLYGKKD